MTNLNEKKLKTIADAEESHNHPPFNLSIKTLNSKEVFALLNRHLFASSQALHGFFIGYDINLKLINELNREMKTFYIENINEFINFGNKEKTTDERISSELTICSPMFIHANLESKLYVQLLYYFTYIFEDLKAGLFRFANKPETKLIAERIREELRKSKSKGKILPSGWFETLESATHFSRHYWEWQPILTRLRYDYFSKPVTFESFKLPQIVSNNFDGITFERKMEIIFSEMSVRTDTARNLKKLLSYEDIAIEVLNGGYSLAKVIATTLELNNFRKTKNKIEYAMLVIEKRFWKIEYNWK